MSSVTLCLKVYAKHIERLEVVCLLEISFYDRPVCSISLNRFPNPQFVYRFFVVNFFFAFNVVIKINDTFHKHPGHVDGILTKRPATILLREIPQIPFKTVPLALPR
jgi:hypothetical protein